MTRSNGVLLHITSLPSPYGIGTLGKAAEEFVDSLSAAGQKYWQVLPLNPVGYGNSPYQSYSAFAGEPLLIDLDDLIANGLLSKKDCEEDEFGADPTFVDFEKVVRVKMKRLKEAHAAFKEDTAYLAFCNDESAWLDDYALFMAIKDSKGGGPWTQWEDAIRSRKPEAVRAMSEELSAQVKFRKFTQFQFRRQWDKLRRYANKNGVKIIGDIPIYASPDSADVWTNPHLFLVDSAGKPTKVAGVPPDYFSETGQLWGNPLYDWGEMKKDGYSWWIERVRKAAQLYDTIRIDHFRAFDTYWAVPFGEKTAVNGKWLNGPGMDLFDALKNADSPEIIAEDLGDLFDSVKELLHKTGFPGMKIMQFGFGGEDNEHLPHNYSNNMAVYTGTHDNSTIVGALRGRDNKAALRRALHYTRPHLLEPLHWACIRSLYASSAGMVIIPMQDLLGLDDRARMNIPGTVGGKNWIWRMKQGAFKKRAVRRLKKLSEVYFR
jgi:4-alpha-glucanotransferase